jgi:polysaccharide biosynthesis transport protein
MLVRIFDFKEGPLKSYLSSLKQFYWIIIACTLLATGAGFIVSKTQPTTYQASSVVLVDGGAPGTTYPGGPSMGGTAADNIGQALNYAAEIPTRSVMQYVLQFDPELQNRHYTADALILAVIPSTSTTAATITLLATAPHAEDAVLIANDVAKGFASYIQSNAQQHLDAQRKNLQTQISNYQQQKLAWEAKLESLPNNTVPQWTVYNNNLAEVTRNIDTLQTQLSVLPATVNGDVAVIQLATAKDVVMSAKGLIITAVAAGVGLLVGILVMLLVIFLDNRLHSDEEIKEKLGLAYLGSLSNNKEIKEAPTSPTGEAVHELADIRTNLRLTGVLPGPWQAPQGAVLLVTSPQVADGKTTLASALSTIVARGGSTVVVIDGNLRQPSTHLAFGMGPTGVGLSGLLKGAGTVDDAVVRSNTPGVWVLPAGNPMEDATPLIEQKLPGILRHLRNKTDLIIIDGPALLNSADASLLATMADGVALVVDAKHEKMPQLLRARELLYSLTHRPTGVVMNRLARRRRNVYYATSYPAIAAPERPVAVQVYADGGNGQRPEPVVMMPVMKASPSIPMPSALSSAGPSGLLSSPPMRGMPSDRLPESPMMPPQHISPRLASRRVDMNPPPPVYPGKSE